MELKTIRTYIDTLNTVYRYAYVKEGSILFDKMMGHGELALTDEERKHVNTVLGLQGDGINYLPSLRVRSGVKLSLDVAAEETLIRSIVTRDDPHKNDKEGLRRFKYKNLLSLVYSMINTGTLESFRDYAALMHQHAYGDRAVDTIRKTYDSFMVSY